MGVVFGRCVYSVYPGGTAGIWMIDDDGKLDVDSNGFTTTGSLIWKGGTLEVEAQHGLKMDFGVAPPPA